MKKLLLIAFVIMISCNDENVLQNYPTESLRKELVSKNTKDLKDAFISLTPELKRDLWRDRLMLESEFYTGEKREYLTIIAQLQRVSSKFDPQSAKAKTIELFGFEEANRILTTLYLPGEKPVINASAKVDPTSCECSYISDWCDFQYNSGNPEEFWQCQPNTGCNESVAGCGTMFLYACEGLCRRISA